MNMRPAGALLTLALGLRALLPAVTAQSDAVDDALPRNPHGRALPFDPLCPDCSCPLPVDHRPLVRSALASLESRLASRAADALGELELEPGTLAEALLLGGGEVVDLPLSVLDDLFPPDWIDGAAAEDLDVAEVLRKRFAGVLGSKGGALSVACSPDGGDDYYGSPKEFSMDVVVEGHVAALDLDADAPHNTKEGDLSPQVFVALYPTKGLDVASLPAMEVAYKLSFLVRTDAATKEFVADAHVEAMTPSSRVDRGEARSDLWDEIRERKRVPMLFRRKEK